MLSERCGTHLVIDKGTRGQEAASKQGSLRTNERPRPKQNQNCSEKTFGTMAVICFKSATERNYFSAL